MTRIEREKARDWAVELYSNHYIKAIACCSGLILLSFLLFQDSLLTASNSAASTTRGERILGCEKSDPFVTNPPYPAHRPIWIASYPSCYMDRLLVLLIDSLVGHKDSVLKLYQMKGSQQQEQFMLFEDSYNNPKITACITSYPLLNVMGNENPSNLTDHFNRAYIVALQNPFKAIYGLAAMEYGRNNQQQFTNNTTQSTFAVSLPRAKWIRYRDKHFLDALEDWTRLVTTWKQDSFYRKSYYAVYEQFIDAQQGPIETNKLAYVLHQAENQVSSVTNNACLWKAVMDAWQEPSVSTSQMVYKLNQRTVMVQHLEEFAAAHQDDSMLVTILEQYIEEMERDIVIG
jgi:hypothetical protein